MLPSMCIVLHSLAFKLHPLLLPIDIVTSPLIHTWRTPSTVYKLIITITIIHCFPYVTLFPLPLSLATTVKGNVLIWPHQSTELVLHFNSPFLSVSPFCCTLITLCIIALTRLMWVGPVRPLRLVPFFSSFITLLLYSVNSTPLG